MTKTEDLQALEDLYNEAENNGTLDEGQQAAIAELAQELDTTEDILKASRQAREARAAEQLAALLPKLEENATHGNARDNWRHNKSN